MDMKLSNLDKAYEASLKLFYLRLERMNFELDTNLLFSNIFHTQNLIQIMRNHLKLI